VRPSTNSTGPPWPVACADHTGVARWPLWPKDAVQRMRSEVHEGGEIAEGHGSNGRLVGTHFARRFASAFDWLDRAMLRLLLLGLLLAGLGLGSKARNRPLTLTLTARVKHTATRSHVAPSGPCCAAPSADSAETPRLHELHELEIGPCRSARRLGRRPGPGRHARRRPAGGPGT
jgi:hypothetical protein